MAGYNDGRTGMLHSGNTVPGTGAEGGYNNPGYNNSPGYGNPSEVHNVHNVDTRNETHNNTANTHNTYVDGHNGSGIDLRRSKMNGLARTLLTLAILLWALALATAVVGMALVQKRLKSFNLSTAAGVRGYENIFQSANLTAWPGNHGYQWSFQWFILGAEFIVLVLTAIFLLMPRGLLRSRHLALTLGSYVFVLATFQCASFLWLEKSNLARSIFTRKRLIVPLAGWLGLAAANFLAIFALGLLRNKEDPKYWVQPGEHGHHGKHGKKKGGLFGRKKRGVAAEPTYGNETPAAEQV